MRTRSPIRFSIRTLFIGITLTCLVIGLLFKDAVRYDAKKRSLRALIEASGGQVEPVGTSPDAAPGHNPLTAAFGLSERFEELWRVDLSNAKITAKQAAVMQGCNWIRYLDLSGTPLDDDALKFVSRMDKLRELKLNQLPISDAALDHLKSLDRLILLETEGTGVTDDGLAALDASFATPRYFRAAKIASRFPLHGVTLSYDRERVTKHRDEKHLRGIPSRLRPSTISCTDLTAIPPELFEQLRCLTMVKSLHGFSREKRFDLHRLCSDCKDLRYVSFSGGCPSETDMEDISKLPRLKYLSFFASRALTDDEVRALGRIDSLEALTLRGVHGSLARAPLLVNCRNLRRLSLSAIRQGSGRRLNPEEIADVIAYLQPLQSLPKLESLRFTGNDVQDEVLLSLVEFKRLKQVVVLGADRLKFLTDEAMAEFQRARPDIEFLTEGVSDSIDLDDP